MAAGALKLRAKYCHGVWEHFAFQNRTILEKKITCFRPFELW